GVAGSGGFPGCPPGGVPGGPVCCGPVWPDRVPSVCVGGDSAATPAIGAIEKPRVASKKARRMQSGGPYPNRRGRTTETRLRSPSAGKQRNPDLQPARRRREDLALRRREVLSFEKGPVVSAEHPGREHLQHEGRERLARAPVALGVDPATVRDPGPLLLVAGMEPAVRIEPVRFRVGAFVEQGGADAADSLVPPGNADAVEAALALHLAEEGDGQDGRDP